MSDDEPYSGLLRTYAQLLQEMAGEQLDGEIERRRALALAAVMMESLATDEEPLPERLH